MRKKYDYLKLKKVAYEVLCAAGIPEDDAKVGADVLNTSDLRGVDSHGLGRLKVYYDGIKAKTINKEPKIKIIKDTGSVLLIDADNGLGIATAPRIMQMCIDRARETGVCVASTRNTNHFGIAAYYSTMAGKQDMIGVCSANTLPLTAPFGGRERMLGSNPIGLSAPCGKHDIVTLDMATATVALGKVEIAIREGKKIPTNWIIGPKGEKTDNPHDFFEGGALLPMAGPKGSGISIFIEIFSALLAGASVGDDVGYLLLNRKKESIGHFMLAIDINQFRDLDEFKADMDKYYDRIKSAEKAEGVKEIFMPGEIEERIFRERKVDGIPLNPVVIDNVLNVAKELGIVDQSSTFDEFVDQL